MWNNATVKKPLATLAGGPDTTLLKDPDNSGLLVSTIAHGGPPANFAINVTDVAAPLAVAATPVLPGSVSVQVNAAATGPVFFGDATVTAVGVSNAAGSREDGLFWNDLNTVWAVCAAGKIATIYVRTVLQ